LILGFQARVTYKSLLLSTTYRCLTMVGQNDSYISLQYFSDIVEEVRESAIPESYWEPLGMKVTRMEQQWQQANPNRP